MTEAGREMSLDEVLDKCAKLHPQHRARLELAELRDRIEDLRESLRSMKRRNKQAHQIMERVVLELGGIL